MLLKQASSAYQQALRWLARREYGAAEITHRLIVKGFGEAEIARALESLKDEGLQSDQRFVESFIHSRYERGQGPVKILHELRERGISSAVTKQLLSEAGFDWAACAKSARRKRYGKAVPTDFRERARQMRYLQARGFPHDLIDQAFAQDDIESD